MTSAPLGGSILMPSETWDGDQLAQIQLAAQKFAATASAADERWRNVVRVAQLARTCGMGAEETVQEFYQRAVEQSKP